MFGCSTCILTGRIKEDPLRYSCSLLYSNFDLAAVFVITDISNVALQIATGKTFLDRPRQRTSSAVAMVHLNP